MRLLTLATNQNTKFNKPFYSKFSPLKNIFFQNDFACERSYSRNKRHRHVGHAQNCHFIGLTGDSKTVPVIGSSSYRGLELSGVQCSSVNKLQIVIEPKHLKISMFINCPKVSNYGFFIPWVIEKNFNATAAYIRLPIHLGLTNF